jgi:F0F1-type ATP synthase assembly protein I
MSTIFPPFPAKFDARIAFRAAFILPSRTRPDIVKKYTNNCLTFLPAVGQYPDATANRGESDSLQPSAARRETAMLPGDSRDMRRYFAYSQIGLEMVAPIVVGLLLDLWLHCLPWGVLTGVVLGLSVGMVHLVYLVNKDDPDSSPPGRTNGKRGD